MFTNLGHYLYVPVHEIVETKWKELGKHISNLIPLSEEEKVISAMILDNKETNVIMTTKNGTTKRTNLGDLIVSRWTKPVNAMKLKDGDELVSVVKDNGRAIFVTENGYYINIDSNEIPIVGAKASGVKGINLKEDNVVTCLSPAATDEYIAIFTNKNTGKRIKLSDLDTMTRAKKGSTLIKKVKSNPYLVENAISVGLHDIVGIKSDGEFTELKSTELSIMDLSSTGSTVSRTPIEETFIVAELKERKMELNESDSKKEEHAPEPKEQPSKETAEELTIDDFIEDFKL
jgi:topoisomerase-4 subunit A